MLLKQILGNTLRCALSRYRSRRRPPPRSYLTANIKEEENDHGQGNETCFDHENLDVYQLEFRFVGWVAALLANIKQRPTDARIAEVSDQFDRASLTPLLNTAEVDGRRQRQTRAKFFDDARGSVTECAACLDALVAKRICTKEELQEGKEMLLRIADAHKADCTL